VAKGMVRFLPAGDPVRAGRAGAPLPLSPLVVSGPAPLLSDLCTVPAPVPAWPVMPDVAPDSTQRAAMLLRQARRIVVLTGAGISTDSGIQDFRGPDGLWTKNPAAERAATIEAYLSDPEVRRRSWRNRLTSPMWDSEPNAGHRALVALELSGRLDTLVTQNVDRLHQKAGTDPSRVIEIHGNSLEVVCLRCGDRQPCEPVHARVRAGEDDPTCLCPVPVGAATDDASRSVCGGILKSATISFGQSLVPEDLMRAEEAASRCDLLLAVGSTLGVFPAAGLVPVAVRHGAVVVIVNGGPTEMDDLADVVVRGSISELLPALTRDLGAD
jgi:NAD-dependent deacetylase